MQTAVSDVGERFESLARLAQTVSTTPDLSEVLQSVAEASLALLPDSSSRVWVAEDDRLVLRASAGTLGERGAGDKKEFALGQGLTGQVALAREPLIIDDVRNDPRVVNRRFFAAERYVSFIGVPLLAKDTLVGVLSLMTRAPHAFSLHEVEVLGAFGAQAAIAIDYARTSAELAARLQRLDALARVNRLISASLDPKEVLHEIAAAGARLLDAPVAEFWLADNAARCLTLVAFAGGGMDDSRLNAIPYERSFSGWVARHHEPLNVPDVSTDDRLVDREWWEAHGLMSYYGVPVVLDGVLLAVLSFIGRRPFRPHEDQTLLDSFTAQAAIAIRNAQLFAESERRRRAAEALVAVGRDLARSLDPREIGRLIADAVHRLLDAKTVGLYLLDAASKDLLLLVAAGPVEPANRTMARGTGALGLAVRERRPFVTTDVLADGRVVLKAEARARIEETRAGAELAVPLLLQGKVMGALLIADGAGRLYTAEQIELAQTFADRAALALDNAELLRETRTREARLEALLETSRQLSGIQPLDSLLGTIAEGCGSLLDADVIGLHLVDGDELVLVTKRGEAAERIFQPRIKIGASLSGRVATTGRPLIVTDLPAESTLAPEQRELARQLGHRAWLGVPVKAGNRLLGVLAMRTRAEHGFSDVDVAIATAFASQAAIALDNARLYEDVQLRLRHTETLLNVGHAVSATLDATETLRRVAREIARALGADMAVACLVNAGDGLLRPVAGYHVPPHLRDLLLVDARPLTGHPVIDEVWQTRAPVWWHDDTSDPRIDRALLDRLPHRSLLIAPMMVKGRPVGAIFALWGNERSPVTAEELRLVEGIADQGALAVENATLYQESEERRRAAEALLDIAQALGSTLDLSEIFETVAQRAAQAVGAERCSIHLERRGQIVPVIAQFSDGRVDTDQWARFHALGPYRADDLPAYAEATRTKRPVAIDDTRASPLLPTAWAEAFGVRSMLIVPLLHQDRVVGSLNLDVQDRPHAWSQDQIDLAMTIANQAALAVENARLFNAQREAADVSGALLRLAQAVEGVQDLDQILESVVRITAQLLGAARCLLYLHDPTDGALVPAAAWGLADRHRPAFLALRGQPRIPAVVETARSQEPIVVEDTGQDTWIPRSVAEALDLRSLVVIPLVSGGRFMGTMSVDTPGERRTFTDKQITLARGIAAHAAGAIDRAQLHAETERRRREAEVFAELAQTINASLDLDTILQSVAEWAKELCRSEMASIALRDPATEGFTIRYWVGRAPGVTALAAIDQPVARTTPAGAELAAPIQIGGRAEGILCVATGAHRPLTARDQTILARLAEHAAAAIHNGQLYAREQAARAAAEASGQRFRDLVEGLDAIVWEADAATLETLFVSRRAEQILGYLAEQWLAEPRFWINHLHPEDRERMALLVGVTRGEGAVRESEYRMLAADGRGVWVRDIVRVVRDAEGDSLKLRGVMVDITERKREERELAQRNQALQAEIAHRRGIEQAYQSVNRALRVLSEANHVLVRATDESAFLHALCRIIVDVGGYRMGWVGFAENDPNKSVRPAAQVGFEEGYLERAQITWADTERGQGPTGTAIRTGRPRINRRDDPSFAPWRAEAIKRGYFSNCALPLLWNGKVFGVLGIYADEPAAFDEEEVGLLIRLADNIAYGIHALRAERERTELQEQFRQVQKMEAVGRLAGGVAHDFNNLLTVISGRSQLLLRRLREADPIRRDIVLVQKTAERATALTRQLLAFSRKQVLQPKVVSLDAIVSGLAPMLQRLIGEDIDLAIVPGAADSRVKADPGQIEQVIVNLVVNARDAMPHGGRLVIETAAVMLDEAFVRQHTGTREGAHVMLAVTDPGVGMSEEVRSRVFEPFFTTKGAGQGTGLGLSTVYGIVQQHQGGIDVESVVGLGTTFRVYLPVTTDPPEAPAGEGPAGLPTGTETILLVEDEDEVRALARDILRQSGYTVLESATPSEALAIGHEHAATIHLLLTDVVMPQMSGREFAERLRPIRPDIKLLYMSGYTDDALGPRALLDPEVVLLQKPFTPDALVRKVRDVLDRDAGR